LRDSTGINESRNTSDDKDISGKELRTFIREALQGQTYALDMLFCNQENILETSNIWEEIILHRNKLLSNNVYPFIGYCRKQAAKYGLKGSRLAELERVINILHENNTYVIEENDIRETEFVKFVVKGTETFLEVLGKKYSIKMKNKMVLKSLESMWNKYGDRAKLAKENSGIDWKAISHAYRCMYEVSDLLSTGEITFPLRQRDFLIKIKQGEIPWNKINIELPLLMKEIEEIAQRSHLPDQPDYEFWDKFLIKIYLECKHDEKN